MNQKNIWQAAEDGDLEQVKKFIGLGVDVNSKNDDQDYRYYVCELMISSQLFDVSLSWPERLTLFILLSVCIREVHHCTLQQWRNISTLLNC